MKFVIFTTVVTLSVFFLSSCSKVPATAPQMPPPSTMVLPDTVHFTADILPLFATKYSCTGCHSGGFDVTQNHQSFESYEYVLSGNPGFSTIPKSDHGPVVTPGHGDSSIVVEKMRGTTFGARMPYGGAAADPVDILKIVKWIDQGAKNN